MKKIVREKSLPVTEITEDKRIFYGQEREFIKIYTKRHQDLQKVRDAIKILEAKRGGSGSIIDEFEYQISPYRMYLAEKQLSCLQWLEIETHRNQIKSIKKATANPPKLKILAFDMEVIEVQRGTPSIVMISIFGEGLSRVITYQEAKYTIDATVVKNEKELIKKLY